MRFWKQRRHEDQLEHDLRSGRPEPSSEFVREVSARVRGRRRPQMAWRLGLAITAVLAVALASIGGVTQGTHAIRQVVGLSRASESDALKQDGPSADPAKDQYKEARKVCQRTEDERHKNAQQQEEQTHKANMEAIKQLPKDQQQAAREAEEARHHAAEQSEQQLHHENVRTCHEIGK